MLKLSMLSLLVLGASCASTQYAQRERSDPLVSQAQFAKIKSLAGEWSGGAGEKTAEGEAIKISYKVTAGGSAVEETLLAGTPQEMVTMYHLDFNDLVMTHYCAAGNQPTMIARSTAKDAGADKIQFDFRNVSNLTQPDKGHMHSLELEFVDANHLRAHWQFYQHDKPTERADFEYTRSNASKQARAIIEADVNVLLADELR